MKHEAVSLAATRATLMGHECQVLSCRHLSMSAKHIQLDVGHGDSCQNVLGVWLWLKCSICRDHSWQHLLNGASGAHDKCYTWCFFV